jgi:hypothetical protein
MLTETPHPGSCLINVAEGHRSVDNGTLIMGQDLPANRVVGQITASKKWTGYDPNASDGSQTRLGILYAAVDATDADSPCVVITRDCEVIRDQLTYTPLSPAAVPATAEAALAVYHVIVR